MLQKREAICLIAAAIVVAVPPTLLAQSAPGAPAAGVTSQGLSAQQLENIVAPVALYPDDLLAILLPSATTPLEIVKAQRFLDRRKSDPKLQPDASMPAPVKSLLNYPDVVKRMSDDLDWTSALGAAVTVQQKDVVDAIQAFRRKVYAVGNLKSDDKQIVVVEKETIKVVQANPQVIYVPQYQPAQVVVVSSTPVYAYYPTPYPVYYYPYPPGAAFATGVFVGATTAYAFNWNNATINYNYNVNSLQQERINYANNAQTQRQGQSAQNQTQRQGQAAQNQTQRQDAVSGTTSANQAQRQQAAANQQTPRQQGAAQTQQQLSASQRTGASGAAAQSTAAWQPSSRSGADTRARSRIRAAGRRPDKPAHSAEWIRARRLRAPARAGRRAFPPRTAAVKGGRAGRRATRLRRVAAKGGGANRRPDMTRLARMRLHFALEIRCGDRRGSTCLAAFPDDGAAGVRFSGSGRGCIDRGGEVERRSGRAATLRPEEP